MRSSRRGAVFHAFLEGDGSGVIKGFGGFERHHGVVSGGIFTLESLRLERGFTTIPNEHGGGLDDGFLGEELLGEGSGKAQCDLIATLHR